MCSDFAEVYPSSSEKMGVGNVLERVLLHLGPASFLFHT